MNEKETIKAFKALGHIIRYKIITELQKATTKGLQPMHLLEKFNISFPALSFHLNKLENAQLIKPQKKGVNIFYTINSETLTKLENTFTK